MLHGASRLLPFAAAAWLLPVTRLREGSASTICRFTNPRESALLSSPKSTNSGDDTSEPSRHNASSCRAEALCEDMRDGGCVVPGGRGRDTRAHRHAVSCVLRARRCSAMARCLAGRAHASLTEW
jgi:hypothetical protein